MPQLINLTEAWLVVVNSAIGKMSGSMFCRSQAQACGQGMGRDGGWWWDRLDWAMGHNFYGHVTLLSTRIDAGNAKLMVCSKSMKWTSKSAPEPGVHTPTDHFQRNIQWKPNMVWLTYEGDIFRSHVRKLYCPIWLPPVKSCYGVL